MVGGQDHRESQFRKPPEDVERGGMTKPGFRQRTIGGIRPGKLPDHLRFRPRMREHVDKIHDYDIEGNLLQLIDFLQKPFSRGGIVKLIIGELLLPAVTVELGLYQSPLVDIQPFVFILLHP